MDSECRIGTLKIAVASYDRRELRVQKHYLEEEGPFISCSCFQSGERLLRELQQENAFDVVILCSEMEDMTGLEFLMNARKLEHPPILLVFDEAHRNNDSALYMETENGMICLDVNCSYLTSAVDVAFGNSQKMAIRKEILQAVGEKYGISVSAVDSGIRRMLDQLEANNTEAWAAFKEENGFAGEKLTTGKLMRIPVGLLRAESNTLQQMDRLLLRLRLAAAQLVEQHRICEDLHDLLPGIQGGIGILKDHLHLPTDGAHLLRLEPGDIASVEYDLAGLWLDQLDDGAGRGRLSTSGLSHQAEHLALLHIKADIVDRMDHPIFQ